MVDLVAIAVLAFCAVRGYFRGAVRNVLELAALAVAYFGSGPFASPIGRILTAWTGLSAGAAYLGGRAIAALCIYVPLAIAATIADRRFGRTKEGKRKRWNRILGAAFGFAFGLFVALLFLFLADVGVKVFPSASGFAVRSARASFLRRGVSRFNPADRFLITDVLRLLRAARDDPEVLRRLSEHRQIRTIMNHPLFRKLQQDEQFAAALRNQQITAVLSNRNLQNLLADKELRSLILSPQTRAAFREAMGEGE